MPSRVLQTSTSLLQTANRAYGISSLEWRYFSRQISLIVSLDLLDASSMHLVSTCRLVVVRQTQESCSLITKVGVILSNP